MLAGWLNSDGLSDMIKKVRVGGQAENSAREEGISRKEIAVSGRV